VFVGSKLRATATIVDVDERADALQLSSPIK
jgi:hypothetical protein